MTVSSTSNRKTFTGDGATVAFATSPVVFFEKGDLTVYLVTTATGAATLQTITTHYTVSGGDGSTGTVTMVTAPTSAQTLVIVRELDLVQEVDFVDNEATDAEVAEDALDKLTMMVQQLDAAIDRSFHLADSDVTGASLELPTPAASKLIGWDSAGTALANYAAASIVDTIVPTAFMETLLDDATAEEALNTLIGGATAETTPAAGDLVGIIDVSLTPDRGRQMTLANLLKVITALTAETAPDVADELALYDASAGTADKITLANLLKVINTLTADATPAAAADYLVTYDASASAAKKVLINTLPGTVIAGSALTMNPYALSTTATPVAHGLGAIPTFLVAELECLSTDAGYAAGEVIELPTANGATVTSHVIYKTATNIGLVTHDTAMPAVPHASTQANTNIDVTKWKLTIKPYRVVP